MKAMGARVAPAPSRPARLPRKREPERLGDVALPRVQRGEYEIAGPGGGVQGRREMPQIGAAQVARFEHGREFGAERPVGQHPFDPRDRVLPKRQGFARERRPQLGLEQVGGDQEGEIFSWLARSRAPGSSKAIAVNTELST